MNNKDNNNLTNLYGTNNNENMSSQTNGQSNIIDDRNNVVNNYQNDANIYNQNNEQSNIIEDRNNVINDYQTNTNIYNQGSNINIPIDSQVNNYNGTVSQQLSNEPPKSEVIDYYINSNLNSNISNNQNTNDDEEYLKAFVGEKYPKIKKSSISIPGFFFSEFYMLYRKMFVPGIILGIIRIIILSTPFIYLSIIINILCMVTVNKIYLNTATKKVNKIKINMINNSKEEILKKCTATGGTNIGLAIGGVLLEIIIVSVFSILGLISIIDSTSFTKFLPNNSVNDNTTDNSETTNNSNNSDNNNNSNFGGTLLYDTNINIADKLTITVPDNFTNDSTNPYEYRYTYNNKPNSNYGKCSFSFRIVTNYTDPKNLAEEMAKYYNNNTNIIITTHNSINWYGLIYNADSSKIYNYFAQYNNQLYSFEYEIGKDADEAYCYIFIDQLLYKASYK